MSGNSYTKISALVPLCLTLPQGVGVAVGDAGRICRGLVSQFFLLLSLFLMATKGLGVGSSDSILRFAYSCLIGAIVSLFLAVNGSKIFECLFFDRPIALSPV